MSRGTPTRTEVGPLEIGGVVNDNTEIVKSFLFFMGKELYKTEICRHKNNTYITNFVCFTCLYFETQIDISRTTNLHNLFT